MTQDFGQGTPGLHTPGLGTSSLGARVWVPWSGHPGLGTPVWAPRSGYPGLGTLVWVPLVWRTQAWGPQSNSKSGNPLLHNASSDLLNFSKCSPLNYCLLGARLSRLSSRSKMTCI